MSGLTIRARLFHGGEIAMGPGKADLLAAIDGTGSISGAGRAMGMSYRRAWLLVDAMNRCWAEPLVDTATGGRKGGGARLSEAGRTALAAYRELMAELERTAEGSALSQLANTKLKQ